MKYVFFLKKKKSVLFVKKWLLQALLSRLIYWNFARCAKSSGMAWMFIGFRSPNYPKSCLPCDDRHENTPCSTVASWEKKQGLMSWIAKKNMWLVSCPSSPKWPSFPSAVHPGNILNLSGNKALKAIRHMEPKREASGNCHLRQAPHLKG